MQQLQQSSESLEAVYAVDKDQGPARVQQQEVVEIHVLVIIIIAKGKIHVINVQLPYYVLC